MILTMAHTYIYIYICSLLLSPVTLKRLDASVARQSCTESNWQRPGSECFQSSNPHRVFVCCPACCVMYLSTLLSRSCSPHVFLLEDVPTARQVWRGQVFVLARRPPREAVRISRLATTLATSEGPCPFPSKVSLHQKHPERVPSFPWPNSGKGRASLKWRGHM